jgi:DNA-binding NarL/FixJ family response regulator
MDGSLTVVVIDDHPAVRAALIERIELRTRFVVVGQAGDGLGGLDTVRRLQPHAALVDFRLPLLRGDEVTRIIRRRWPDVAVVAMSSSAESDAVQAMLVAGAAGYLKKGDPVDDLEQLAFGERGSKNPGMTGLH